MESFNNSCRLRSLRGSSTAPWHSAQGSLAVFLTCVAGLVLSSQAHAETAVDTRARPSFEFSPISQGGRVIKPRLELPGPGVRPPPADDEVRIHRYNAISLVEGSGPLAISFGPPDDAARFAVRLQFKLEGYDAEWRDLTQGSVHLVLKFLDANRIPVSREEFRVSGASVGWAGTLEKSILAQRATRAMVPPRAKWVDVWIDSGGHDETSGVWLVDDLMIRQTAAGGDPLVLLDENFEEGQGLERPQGDPTRWVRDGGALDDALVWSGPPAKGGHALLIRDSNPRDYAAWRLKTRNQLPVEADSTLDLSWQEVFSIGAGRNGNVSYRDLPSGQYQFRVREVDALGVPSGEQAVLPLIIAPPFYANLWFRMALLVTLLAMALGMERVVARRRMQRKLEKLKRNQAVQQERARIARDIHDDLGTVLSRISMVSEAAASAAEPGSPQEERLNEICETSRQLTRTMEEIVWAQDPRHDSLDNMVSYICSFASDLLGVARIACRLDIPIELPVIPLEAEQRHELFLVFKEALNNIIKHSGASEVRISLRIEPDTIRLVVEDNGRGFDAATLPEGKGNGLPNMRNRLQRLGGQVDVHSEPGKGTRVEIIQPTQVKTKTND
ncbi:MAG: ATP-binding protein [Luteolibacter sp.]